MNKKVGLLVGGAIVVLLLITGFVVYKAVFSGTPASSTSGSTQALVTQPPLPQASSSISVDLVKSTTTANAVDVNISGMGGKMSGFDYELQYTSNGLEKGVTSGTTPIDVSGKDTFSREIYLGTCSRNVCTPDPAVSGLTLNLVFTDSSGKQSQFSKDYIL